MKRFFLILSIFALGAAVTFAYLYKAEELTLLEADTQIWTDKQPLIKPEGTSDLNIFIKIAEKLSPTVVNVNTTQKKAASPKFKGFEGDEFFRKFFDDFFGPGPMPRRRDDKPQKSLGSGFIISDNGYIITNNHVVENADEIKVKLSEDAKESYDATLVGTDARTDIALLKINVKGQKLPVAPLGDSTDIKVGEWVAAIGHPFGYGHTVSHGIVSAKERLFGDGISHPYNDYIQTDASINLGNSGGPLINAKGEVVGINVATDARAQGIIGFAIPINVAKTLIPQLMTTGHAVRGFIGIQWFELTDELRKHFNLKKDQQGVVIAEIIKGEPADLAGLKVYDVIVEFNEKPIKTPRDLLREVAKARVGKAAPLKVLRDGKIKSLKLKPVERKDEVEEKKKDKKSKKEKGKKDKVDLGLEVSDLSKYPGFKEKLEVASGVVVVNVAEGSIAEKAELAKGDVIVEVNRTKINNASDFYTAVEKFKKGNSYLFRIYRNKSYQLAIVKVE